MTVLGAVFQIGDITSASQKGHEGVSTSLPTVSLHQLTKIPGHLHLEEN